MRPTKEFSGGRSVGSSLVTAVEIVDMSSERVFRGINIYSAKLMFIPWNKCLFHRINVYSAELKFIP
jgi:hypothetical protein